MLLKCHLFYLRKLVLLNLIPLLNLTREIREGNHLTSTNSFLLLVELSLFTTRAFSKLH